MVCGNKTENPNTIQNLYDFICPSIINIPSITTQDTSLTTQQSIIPKSYISKHKLKSLIKQLESNINNDEIDKNQIKNTLSTLKKLINKL